MNDKGSKFDVEMNAVAYCSSETDTHTQNDYRNPCTCAEG